MEDKYKNLELLYNNIEESLVSLESQNSLLKLENEKLKDIIWQYERRIVIKIWFSCIYLHLFVNDTLS